MKDSVFVGSTKNLRNVEVLLLIYYLDINTETEECFFFNFMQVERFNALIQIAQNFIFKKNLKNIDMLATQRRDKFSDRHAIYQEGNMTYLFICFFLSLFISQELGFGEGGQK